MNLEAQAQHESQRRELVEAHQRVAEVEKMQSLNGSEHKSQNKLQDRSGGGA